ncbi:MAG: hypothetical protein WKF59_26290 [Chitinophagaceae bacterium]
MKSEYVIGVDYGTDSIRSVLINAHNGQEISASVYYYPRWKKNCIVMHLSTSFVSIHLIM